MEIKFKEELLRLYKRISDLSGMRDRTQEKTINRLLLFTNSPRSEPLRGFSICQVCSAQAYRNYE